MEEVPMDHNENFINFNNNNEEEKTPNESSRTKRKTVTSSINFLILVVIITANLSITSSAPAVPYSKFKSPREKGCYYLLKHYENGQEIETNEPCLNCTCLNSMLMCYLRVCPYVRPLGDRCIIERVPGECCPRITCPDSSVEATTTEPEEGNELGCYIDGEHYKEGAQIPSDPSKPCEVCYCIRNTSSCVVQECTLKVSGCQPLFSSDSCCPTRYNCSEEAATTVPPGLLHPSSPQMGCRANGKNFLDGEAVPSRDACEHCYCMKNEIVCAVQECKAPCEGCVPIPSDNDQCCPERYECAAPTRVTNSSSFQDILPTTTDLPSSLKSEETSATPSALQVKSETSPVTSEPEVVSKSPVAESRVVLIPSQPRREEPGQSRRRPFPSVGVIPGEGICRHEGRVYQNGDEVISRNPCVEYCMCINSVVYCDETVCTEPKFRDGNCTRVKLPTDCCPRYECYSQTTVPITSIPTSTTTTTEATTTTTEITTVASSFAGTSELLTTTTTVPTTTSLPSSSTSVVWDQTTLPPSAVPVSEEPVEVFSTQQPSTDIEMTTHDVGIEMTTHDVGIEMTTHDVGSPSSSISPLSVDNASDASPIAIIQKISSSTLSPIEIETTTLIIEEEKVTRKPISDIAEFSDEISMPATESINIAGVTTTLPFSTSTSKIAGDNIPLEEVFTESRVDTSSVATEEVTTITTAPKSTSNAPSTVSNQSESATKIPEVSDVDDMSNEIEISTKLPELVTTTEKIEKQHVSITPVNFGDATAEVETEKPTGKPLDFERHDTKPIEVTTILSVSTNTEIDEVVEIEDDSIKDLMAQTTPRVPARDSIVEVTTVINPHSLAEAATTSESPLDELSGLEKTTVTPESINKIEIPRQLVSQKPSNEEQLTTPSFEEVVHDKFEDVMTIGIDEAPTTLPSEEFNTIETEMKDTSENWKKIEVPLAPATHVVPTTVTSASSTMLPQEFVTTSMKSIIDDDENVELELKTKTTTSSVDNVTEEPSTTMGAEDNEEIAEAGSLIMNKTSVAPVVDEIIVTTVQTPAVGGLKSIGLPSSIDGSVKLQGGSEIEIDPEAVKSIEEVTTLQPTEPSVAIPSDEYTEEKKIIDMSVESSTDPPGAQDKPNEIVNLLTTHAPVEETSATSLELEGSTKGKTVSKSESEITTENSSELDDGDKDEATTPNLVVSSSRAPQTISSTTAPELISFDEVLTTEQSTPFENVGVATGSTVFEAKISESSSEAIPQTTAKPVEEKLIDTKILELSTTPIAVESLIMDVSTEIPTVSTSTETELSSNDMPKDPAQLPSSTAQPYEINFETTTLATPISLNISSNATADYLLREVTSSPMISTTRPIGNEQLADSESNKILEDDDGSCVFEGKVFQSAEQIPRPHPCDFCFCFRGDIICLQQTCPPPIPRCYETPIQGFCCPRYECPVQSTSFSSNATTPRSVESPKGCQVNGTFYEIGERVQQASGPCLECKCDHSGLMQCNPQTCSPPAPLLLRMNRDFFASTIRR